MAQRRTLARFGQAILHKLRTNVMDHILHMPIKTLDKYGSGRLITRSTNDVETLDEFYSDILVTLFQDILLLISLVSVSYTHLDVYKRQTLLRMWTARLSMLMHLPDLRMEENSVWGAKWEFRHKNFMPETL